MKYHEKVLHRRILSGVLSILLVVGSVINPLSVNQTFASNTMVQFDYTNHTKKDVEIYVQAEDVNYQPGEDMILDLYVQNNTDETLTGIGLSWNGDDEAFESAEFILPANCNDAEINEKGIVVNLNLKPDEIQELQFVGTLTDDLEDLNRKEIVFFYGSKNERGIEVTGRATYEFTIGLFGELDMEFEDGNEIVIGETNVLDITMDLNDLGYYYESAVKDDPTVEVEIASDADALTATDSNSETTSDSDAESDVNLATDSNSEEEIVTATDSNPETVSDSDAEEDMDVVSDADAEEETDSEEEEEHVFEITGIEFDLDTYGAEFKKVKLTDSSVEEGKAQIAATVEYKVADDAEPGTYFGTLIGKVKQDKKVYKAEIGFCYEVVEENPEYKKKGNFSAELENLTVNAIVPRGAFDEAVKLVASELTNDSEEYKEAEAAMADHEKEYDGMMALDIRFVNEAGIEVEPKEGYNVQVSIQMKMEKMPSAIDGSSLMVHHLAEDTESNEIVVQDVADVETATEGTVTVDEEVVEAEFEVEGFSTFTITWSYASLTMYLIDQNGESIGSESRISINDSGVWENLAEIAPEVDGYVFSKAVASSLPQQYVTRDGGGYTVVAVGYAGGWIAANGGGTVNVGNSANDFKIYLVYEQPGNVTEVAGAFPTGVSVHMFDYGIYVNDNTGIDGFNFYHDVKEGQNIAQDGIGVNSGVSFRAYEELDNDKYPILYQSNPNVDGKSMKSLFKLEEPFYKGTAYNGGGLFQLKSDGSGYYYDSSKNAATFYPESVSDDKNIPAHFKLYSHTIYPDYGWWNNEYNYQYTNFLPFNDARLIKNDEPLSNSSTKNPPVFTNSRRLAQTADMWFGMLVEFDFRMSENGLVNGTGEPMIFEFQGDDDVYVFIDDQLVLDIGGVHDAVEGSIDFLNGKSTVKWSESKLMPGLDDVKDFSEIFEGTETEADLITTKNGGETITRFKDHSVHTLKFFYLERGGSVSYCKLEFNLETLPEKALTVTKELENVDSNGNTLNETVDYVKENQEYQFRVVKADKPTELYVPANVTYSILEDGELTGKTGKTDANGIFKLKVGQSAVFENMLQHDADNDGQANYIVEELLGDDIVGYYKNSKYEVSGTGGTTATGDAEINSKKFTTFKTGSLSAAETQYVTYRNRVDVSKLAALQITKAKASGASFASGKEFPVYVKLDGTLVAKGTPYTLNGTDKTVTSTDGSIKLKIGDTAVFSILEGSTYEVYEGTDDSWTATYSGNVTSSSGDEGAIDVTSDRVTGNFTPGDTVKITVTNADKSYPVTINLNKTTSGFEDSNSRTFEFQAVPCTENGGSASGTTYPETISVSGNGTESGTIKINFKSTTTAGTYYYKVTEIAGSEDYVIYDDTEYIVGIAVNGNGASITSVKKDGTSISKDAALEFTNTYDRPPEGTLLIAKELEGTTDVTMQHAYFTEEDLPEGIVFQFNLTSADMTNFNYEIVGNAGGVKVNGVTPSGAVNGVYSGTFSAGTATIQLIKEADVDELASVKLVQIPNETTITVTEAAYADVNESFDDYTSELKGVQVTGDDSTDASVTDGYKFTWDDRTSVDKTITFVNDFKWKIGDITVTKDVIGTDVPTRDFLIQIVDVSGTHVSGTHVDTAAVLKDGETSGVIRVDQVTKLALTETKLKEFNLKEVRFVKTTKPDAEGNKKQLDSGTLNVNAGTGKYEITVNPGEEVSIIVVNEYQKTPFFHDDFGKMNDFGASDSEPIATASWSKEIEGKYLVPERKRILFDDEVVTRT